MSVETTTDVDLRAELDEALSILRTLVTAKDPTKHLEAARAFLARHGAVRSVRPVTIDRMVDKAVHRDDLTPTKAAVLALPKNIYAIPEPQLRDLAGAGIRERVARVRSDTNRGRARNGEEVIVARRVARAVDALDEGIKRYAAVLAGLSFAFNGQDFSGMTLPLEAYDFNTSRLRATIATDTKQLEYFESTAKVLRAAKVRTVGELPSHKLIDVAIKAESTWART